MKEASGELSMTLIVIVAAGVILGIFMLFKDPILNAIRSKWTDWTENPEYTYIVTDNFE